MNSAGGPVDLKKASFELQRMLKITEEQYLLHPPVSFLLHYSVSTYSFENLKVLTSFLCNCSNILYFRYNRSFVWAILDIQCVYWIKHGICLCYSIFFRVCCSHLMIAIYEKVGNEIFQLWSTNYVSKLFSFFFLFWKSLTSRETERSSTHL